LGFWTTAAYGAGNIAETTIGFGLGGSLLLPFSNYGNISAF
jgi:hypothetical protein